MEAGKFSFKFSRQTQKNLVGSSKYAYFRNLREMANNGIKYFLSKEFFSLAFQISFEIDQKFAPTLFRLRMAKVHFISDKRLSSFHATSFTTCSHALLH
jgi:hypothetical protein